MHPPSLSNSQLAIMKLLWEDTSLTARQIREALYADTDKAQHGTVQRLLQRMEDKGFVRRDREAPVHLFSAQISRQAYAGRQLEVLAEQLTGGSLAPLITHMLAEKKISKAELEKLRGLLRLPTDAEGQG